MYSQFVIDINYNNRLNRSSLDEVIKNFGFLITVMINLCSRRTVIHYTSPVFTVLDGTKETLDAKKNP